MEIRSRLFEKYENYTLNIPLRGEDKVLVKKDRVGIGDDFLEKTGSSVKKTIYLPTVLHVKSEDSEKYLVCMHGEYIEKGEVIAKKTSSGGLTVIDLTSPVSGILDLSRIKQGYVDILGEERKSIVKSNFEGEIGPIDPTTGLSLTTDVVAVDGVVGSKKEGTLFGQLDTLGDGNTIVTTAFLEREYKGKIVWVGPYLYSSIAVELFERGAIAVLTYAMSYEEFRDLGLPIMIFGGFGSVHCDSLFLKKFLTFIGKYVVLDHSQNQLFVLSDLSSRNERWFVNQYINQSVISRNATSYGYIGKTLEYNQESDFVLVDFGKKGTSLIHIGLLDFIDL